MRILYIYVYCVCNTMHAHTFPREVEINNCQICDAPMRWGTTVQMACSKYEEEKEEEKKEENHTCFGMTIKSNHCQVSVYVNGTMMRSTR